MLSKLVNLMRRLEKIMIFLNQSSSKLLEKFHINISKIMPSRQKKKRGQRLCSFFSNEFSQNDNYKILLLVQF